MHARTLSERLNLRPMSTAALCGYAANGGAPDDFVNAAIWQELSRRRARHGSLARAARAETALRRDATPSRAG